MRSIYTLLYIRVHEFAEILGDTSDNEFPIYRTPRPSDPCVTAATGIVQMVGSATCCKDRKLKTAPGDDVHDDHTFCAFNILSDDLSLYKTCNCLFQLSSTCTAEHWPFTKTTHMRAVADPS